MATVICAIFWLFAPNIVGAMAERLERRTALIIVVISMLLTSLVLALLAWSDSLEVWHVALASFVNGIAWTTDNPVRRTMIGEVVGPDRMSAAMSLDVGANNASRMLGPTLGGVLLATVGIRECFADRACKAFDIRLDQPCVFVICILRNSARIRDNQWQS